MKCKLYRLMHITIAIAIGIDLLDINRLSRIVCGIIFLGSIIFSRFLMTEATSGWTTHRKIMQEFAIIAGIQGIGFLIFRNTFALATGLIFLIALIFEWKFRVFSVRWKV